MHDERVDLSGLKTPPPLRDSDYASVRGNVLARINRRRRWRIPLQIAAALVAVAAALWSIRPAADPPQSAGVSAPPPPVLDAPAVAVPVVSETRETITIAAEPPARRRHPRSAAIRPSAEPMHIHFQTADPEVRIIWIVDPEKEES